MSQDTIPKRFRRKIQEAKEQQLEKLNLSSDSWADDSQKLTQIPDEVFELTQLKELNLRNNNIQHIPPQISRLTNLKSLDLIGNQELANNIPQEVVQLPSLVTLRLTWNVNTTIPEWFNKIEQLGLNLIGITPSESYDFIKTIPDAIIKLSNLTRLDLSSNQLTELPEALGNLSDLTWLDLWSNQLTKLPEAIGNLSNLTELDLRKNQLTKLPEAIGNLSNLTRLDLNSNQLTELPEALGNLSNLTRLDLNSNQLTELPEFLDNLSNLTRLDLDGNRLIRFPNSISNLTDRISLSADRNPLISVPPNIINRQSIPIKPVDEKIADRIRKYDSIRQFLVGADFRKANLKGVDFYESNLSEAKLDRADFSRTDLTNTILISVQARETNFQSSILTNANLSEANLDRADFSNANLRNANLTKIRALAANFQAANLTGACIEDWNINSETNLDNVICDYIYLKADKQERRPSDPKKKFEPGEFTKLFQKALETVDLIFSDGIDWRAFFTSFEKLKRECKSDELSIYSFENKGDGTFVIKVNVPAGAEKAEIEKYLNKNYELEAELKAKSEELANLYEVTKLLASKDVNLSLVQGNNMAGDRNTDKSRNINISDNAQVTASGAGALSLGDISGTVANTINQLPNFDDEPNKKELKELLTQLQSAVLQEDLDDDDKEETLKQINAIAEALQNSQDGTVKKTAKKAMKMLRGIAADLPKGAAMVTICNQLPDLISKIF